MRRIVPVVLGLTLVLFGCKAKELAEKADIARDLNKRGTVDLMKEVSKDKYTPPADGRLTDGQIQMYLKVRQHEQDIAQVAKQKLQADADASKKAGGEKSLSGLVAGFKGLSDAAEFLTADIRAAKDLGYNTQEYMWVKGKILEASAAAMTQKMTDAMSAQMDASYAQMKKSYDEAKDDQSRAMYKQMLDGFEKSKAESAAQKQKEDPAIAYNQQLLSKYENTLNALASEMSKYEDKPGEAQKGMQQFQQSIDKATADAKKQANQ